MIPVLQQYDHTKEPVGYVSFEDGRCVVRLKKFKTQEEVFRIFGFIGMNVTERSDDGNIKEFEIHCWADYAPYKAERELIKEMVENWAGKSRF